MFKILSIGFGGFLGAVSRYLMSGLVHKILANPWFPYGTFAVNILGCLFIGFLSGLAESRQVLPTELRMFLLIGFLGSFTTFSTFGYETFSFMRDGQMLSALLNILLQIIVGLGAVWTGTVLARYI
ncbi:MAG: fluoride efflux transporter CrcB [Calditrichia bacterium]